MLNIGHRHTAVNQPTAKRIAHAHRGATLRTVSGVIAGLLLAMPLAAKEPASSSDHFHWRPAADPVGWAMFLPGSDGLRVLKDEQHYYRVAEKLNEANWSVLLVDYQRAYRAADNPPSGEAGDKIVWVAGQAAEWLHLKQPDTATQPAALVAWSLGAEGVIRIINDAALVDALGVSGAAAYYPSNRRAIALNNHIPLLIVSGLQDDVTPADSIKAWANAPLPSLATVTSHFYAGAHHGFDVESLRERRTLRLLPFIGPKATLHYSPQAAEQAEARLLEFLATLSGARTAVE